MWEGPKQANKNKKRNARQPTDESQEIKLTKIKIKRENEMSKRKDRDGREARQRVKKKPRENGEEPGTKWQSET